MRNKKYNIHNFSYIILINRLKWKICDKIGSLLLIVVKRISWLNIDDAFGQLIQKVVGLVLPFLSREATCVFYNIGLYSIPM